MLGVAVGADVGANVQSVGAAVGVDGHRSKSTLSGQSQVQVSGLIIKPFPHDSCLELAESTAPVQKQYDVGSVGWQ